MADQIEVTVSLKVNGVELTGFPYRRRLTVDEAQHFSYEKATGGGHETLPTTHIASLSLLALTGDQSLTLRLDGQSDAGLVLNAGGLALVVDGTIDAGASTNATIDNSSGSTALVKGLGAGT
jgi:hypothetical protein